MRKSNMCNKCNFARCLNYFFNVDSVVLSYYYMSAVLNDIIH